MTVLVALLLLALAVDVASLPLQRRLVARRRAALARRIAVLERFTEMDADSVERRWRAFERERLERTKERYRRIVVAAVGATFDEHFARKRKRDALRRLNRPWPMSYAMTSTYVHTPGAVWTVTDPRQVQVLDPSTEVFVRMLQRKREAAEIEFFGQKVVQR